MQPSPAPSIAEPFERIRQLCKDLPGTTETSSWGHPNFRAGKKTYLTLEIHQGRPSVAFRLAADHVQALCREGNFFSTPHGKGQWASTYLDRRLNWRGIRLLAARSHELALASQGTGKRHP